jgi:hypothetical protein
MSGWKQAEGACETQRRSLFPPMTRREIDTASANYSQKRRSSIAPLFRVSGDIMTYRIVAERDNETVRMDRASSLIALAKARIWASEGWDVTIIVGDQELAVPVEQDLLLPV